MAVGVLFTVVLTSVSDGVRDRVGDRLSNPLIRQSGLVDVDRINHILALLTLTVTVGMLVLVATTVAVLAASMMRNRRKEIGLRRQSGVERGQLIREFLGAMLEVCLVGGILGEIAGLTAALLLSLFTPLPVRFTPVSVFAAFPTTVLLALIATAIPANVAAGQSPKALRSEA